MHHVPSRRTHVVDVAHPEREVVALAADRSGLEDDRVGVEVRHVGAGLEVDHRIGEQVHARR